MTSEILSKQCVIIGGFSIALCLVFIIIEVQDLRSSLDSDEEYHSDQFQRKIIQIIEYAVGILLSVSLILGAIKKRLLFLTIWLLAALAATIFAAYLGISMLLLVPMFGMEMLIPILFVVGLTTIILFPVCSLFKEICLEICRARKQKKYDNEIMNEKPVFDTKMEVFKEV
ncbi:uncharacterized protein LOC105261792 [Musca domestica]|uniref:Uncharacterized protein LOC105261792 n=1 Tax=Musca domestica TaxID=7370 RepID=A0A1I8NJZ6_MUSDO|nr:uncharacterized protein LOC105261792 [Musca domestica]